MTLEKFIAIWEFMIEATRHQMAEHEKNGDKLRAAINQHSINVMERMLNDAKTIVTQEKT